jgi:putative phosphoribosyl transferase
VIYFRNREQAGRQLSLELVNYSAQNPIVLGIPRGGVPVAFEVARGLNAPLDVFVTQRLGVPGHEELPFGAVAEGDGRYIDQGIVHSARVAFGESEMVIRAALQEVAKRARLYRNSHSLPDLKNCTVILVDDGIAAGAEVQAAIASLRKLGLRQLIIAAPVISQPTYEVLRQLVDQVVTVRADALFFSTGQCYEKYPEMEDEQILSLLRISENFVHFRTAPGQLPPAA